MTDEQLVEEIATVLGDACDELHISELHLAARAILPIILAAREEGARAMRDHVARLVSSGMHNEYGRPQTALESAIRAFDPAKIAGGSDA